MKKTPSNRLRLAIGALIALTLGRFSWNSPPWLNYFHKKANNRPLMFWGITLGLIAFFSIAGYAWYWHQHQPRPNLVSANVTAPKITPNEEVLTPNSLTVDFGLYEQGEEGDIFSPKSIAPLDLIGKAITKNINLSPEIPGTWVWESGDRLVFTPSQDWPAGQSYTIYFNKKTFTPGTDLEYLTYTFNTQPFKISIDDFKYYQDPVNPNSRQAVAKVTFNYSVDTSSFENNIRFQFQDEQGSSISAASLKYSVTYDEHKRVAYIHSDTIPLPKTPRYLQLIIDKKVKPVSGNPSIEKVTETILIPDASSYFKVTNANASIVRDTQDRPEQVLTVETTVGVKESELNKGLHVFLLPEEYPATANEEAKPNYEWQNPGQVTPAILKLATPLTLRAIPSDRDYATLHSYKFASDTPRYMYVKLDKGIKSFGDFVLSDGYVAVIKIPEYPKEISFLHKGSLLALNSDKKLSVTVRGLPAVKFQIARVLPDDINQLVTQTQGHFSDPHFINESFNQQNISEIFSEVQSFNDTDLGKAQYTALNLGKYLSAAANTGGPQGLFLLQATGWDTKNNIPLDVKNSRLILMTDLGLLVKDNHDGTHDVFVQSITHGTPVSNVNVAILGKNGLPLLTRTTDAQGRANLPSLKDFIEENEPTVYLAKLGNDVAFIPYNKEDRQLNYSRYDIGGVMSYDQEIKTLSAYLFSDRGIYRPGDTVHLGMIVKRAYAQPEAAGLPLEVIVTDPRGVTVKDQKFLLGPIGFSSLDLKTNDTSPTGQYTVNLYIVKDNHPESLLGSATLHVEEFLPDRMRIATHLSKDASIGWVSPQDLKAEIGLQNLYGAPAAQRKVTARLVLAPQTVQFKEYPQYIFVDPLLDPAKPPKVFTDNLPDAQTNDEGIAQIPLNLGRFDKATYQLTLYTEGFEAEGGRGVATQTTALVSPLQYLIGYKPDGDLKYIKQNDTRHVDFVVINPQLKQQTANNLRIQHIALHPVTTLVKNADGTYQYQSVIQTNILNTTPFAVSDKGASYSLPTTEIGDFAVKILDENNTEVSQFKYTVVGTSAQPLAKNAELTVKLNKTEYLPDEDIELQITAPYTGAGLITIERDNVYAVQWFKTNTPTSMQKIHIPKDFQGNGYVNVAFVRDWNSPEIFVSPLSYSVVPFSVNRESHAIHIDLSTPNIAQPGELFAIQYKTDKPGKIIVFAVDEGILQVANYKTPDPLGFFFQKRALQVLTQQTVDQILPKFMQERELSAVGGDGSEEKLASNLNPFKRKTDLPVVFWSGILDTDSTARALEYRIPDYFNGTLRVMAVAVATDAVGSTDKKSLVKGNFVINPNTPTFVAPGDEFEITASVANNVPHSGPDAKVDIRLSVSPQLEILDNNRQLLTIAEGREQTIHFRLRAKSQLGSAEVTLTATQGDKTSKMNATLSVRPASAYQTSIISGSSTAAHLSLPVDRDLYPEYRKVEGAISNSPLILVSGLQQYLDNFPYGCTEQLTSKAMPLIAMGDLPWFVKDRTTVTDKIQATVQMLSQRQMSNGGFSYWPGGGENISNSFASVYAMHFLTEAKRHGYDVPSDVFHGGLNYLKDLAAANVNNLEDARIKAYAIYILTRNEIVTTNYLTNLQLYLDKDQKETWKQDIISTYMAATYLLLQSYTDANKLLNYFNPTVSATTGYNDFYNQNIAAAQYLYLIATHFPDKLPQVGKALVTPLTAAMNNGEINTVFSGYASLALSAYAQSSQTHDAATLALSETLMDGKQHPLDSSDLLYKKVIVDALAKQINIANPTKQTYFYQLTQSGFDKTLPSKAVKHGIEVYREYRDLKGNVLDKTNLGSDVEVHIQVRSIDNSYINNVAIVDLLPGGFEVVRDSVNQTNMDYADIREDRVVFFGGLTSDAKEIVYRIRATNRGQYKVPPIFAGSMYNPKIRAQGTSGSMTVGD